MQKKGTYQTISALFLVRNVAFCPPRRKAFSQRLQSPSQTVERLCHEINNYHLDCLSKNDCLSQTTSPDKHKFTRILVEQSRKVV